MINNNQKSEAQTRDVHEGLPPAPLLGCPFCGSQKITEAGQDGWWQMLCQNCDAAGPSAGNPYDARRYWQEMTAGKMTEALKITHGNIMSIKSCVGVGVVTYDVWLKVVSDALKQPNIKAER